MSAAAWGPPALGGALAYSVRALPETVTFEAPAVHPAAIDITAATHKQRFSTRRRASTLRACPEGLVLPTGQEREQGANTERDQHHHDGDQDRVKTGGA